MPIVSSGQITITDISDAPVLNAFITANASVSQTYKPGTATWSPSYAASPLTLKLNLLKAGTTTSLITGISGNVTWTRSDNGTTQTIASTSTTDSEYMTGSKRENFVTKVNVPANSGASRITATGNWLDPNTNLIVPFSATIDLTCVQLGETATIPNFYAGQGGVFYNNNPATLTVNADLYKGSGLSAQNKQFKFFIADSSVVNAQHANYDADGGIGWFMIKQAHNGITFNTGPGVNTTNQGILTIPHTAVTNYIVVKCVIVDTSDRNTKYTGIVTLLDYTDPVTITIESTAGNIFKNSSGTTQLIARLFQSGNEIDTAGNSGYTYKWTKRNQNGVLDANFGGENNQYKTGKTISVAASEVSSKATYTCEVHK